MTLLFLAACFVPEQSTSAAKSSASNDQIKEIDNESVPSDTVTEEHEEEDLSGLEEDDYNPDLEDKHVRIRLSDSGEDVFALRGNGKCDYRYGPSIMLGKNGSVDAWFASPGDSKKEYDWITYRHSDNGGVTWGDEKVVLAPTPNTADFKSVCDPDVFYYDGYYYMGYTGTINRDGLCNNLFLARSRFPDGPYDKWDGNGWEGDPVPIVYYSGVDIGWGIGEPSFVIVNDKLYLYYTVDTFSDALGWVRATRVATADLNDPKWPGALSQEGTCTYRNDCTDHNGYTYADSDSWDVAYLEESRRFIAFTTNRRFKDDSCLLYYESHDGIVFERVSELNTDVISGCHNCGLMADGSGHIKKGDKTLIGYAYSGHGNDKWGFWATRFAPLVIDYTDEPDRSEDGKENLKQPIKVDESLLGSGPIMLLTDQLTYTASIDNPVNIRYFIMNPYRGKTGISAGEINIEKYDPRMLKLSDDGKLIPVCEGISTVRVEYEGLRRDIRIRVMPDGYDSSQIRRFYPACKRCDLSVGEPIILKVRPMAVFEDYSIHELSGYERSAYEITFRSSDTSVCSISADGTLTPIGAGSAVITVTSEDCKYTVDVYVSE
ncbi:MAG: glycoside hydrolase [Lachnospiraceae bacterium]|nr:glycoside hydrolase [Lachnospiraceae bacterium]